MCQAYEGERRYIAWTEKIAREKGYNAKKSGMTKASNPYHSLCEKYQYDAWNLGWDIRDEGGKLW